MVSRLDDWVLDKLSWLAGKVQILTGYDCLTQAHYCWRLGWLFYAIRDFYRKESLGLVLDVAMILMSTPLQFRTDPNDDVVRSAVLRGFRNPRRITLFDKLLRALYISVLPVAIIIASVSLFHFQGILIVLYAWLRCCDPLPETGSKIREWMDSLVPKPQTVTANES